MGMGNLREGMVIIVHEKCEKTWPVRGAVLRSENLAGG
jgi:hypothetical protein